MQFIYKPSIDKFKLMRQNVKGKAVQWPRELAGVRTKVSFSAVNNSNKPQTGVKVTLSDQP